MDGWGELERNVLRGALDPFGHGTTRLPLRLERLRRWRSHLPRRGVDWRGQWGYPCAGDEDGYPYRLDLWLPGESEGRYRVSGLGFGVRCVYPDVRDDADGMEWFPAMEEMWTVLEAMVQVYYATVDYEEPDPDGPFAYLFEEDR